MPKIKHPQNEGHPVFVTTSCFGSAPCFEASVAAELVIEQIDRLRSKGIWWVSEYVVMPDHVHLIVLPIKPLGYGMQEFKKSVARLINWKGDARGGKIWLDEYHSRVILDAREYANEVQYVWWNPVKAGLVLQPEDFAFSSANPNRKTDREKFY